jgi:hypothetical protein
METEYTKHLVSYLNDLFKNERSHYCDMLIIEISQLSILRPSINTVSINLYDILNINTASLDQVSIDFIDQVTLEHIIAHCATTELIAIDGIRSVMMNISNYLSDVFRIPSCVVHEELKNNEKLIRYFLTFHSAILETLNTHCRFYINGNKLGFETDTCKLPTSFYVYDNTNVYFRGSQAAITLGIRFYRKK